MFEDILFLSYSAQLITFNNLVIQLAPEFNFQAADFLTDGFDSLLFILILFKINNN